jgi:hypothetical protein
MEKILSDLLQIDLILIGIVPLIYVLSVSLMGRAIKKQQEEEESSNKRHIDDLAESFEVANKSYRDVNRIADAKKILDDIVQEDKKYKTKIKEIHKKYDKLSLNGIVTPLLWFIIAFCVIILTKGILLKHNTVVKGFDIVILILLIIIGIIIKGIYEQYQIMKIIQEVAYPADEAYMKMTVDAFRKALTEHEKEKSPNLVLTFTKPPPFAIAKGNTLKIEFELALNKGEPARNAQVHFYAPPGFDFPSITNKWPQDNNFIIPNAITITAKFKEPILMGIRYSREIEIKVPDTPGRYELRYRLVCEKFASDENIPFTVIVT